MNGTVFQVCTVCLLILFTGIELIEMLLKQRRMDSKDIPLWSVSYTHLDVYKRQVHNRTLQSRCRGE